MKKYKKIWMVIFSILLFLIITNPSLQNFKEYKGIEPEAQYDKAVRRNYNFILFSIYQQSNGEGLYYDNYYLGIAANFILFSG